MHYRAVPVGLTKGLTGMVILTDKLVSAFRERSSILRRVNFLKAFPRLVIFS